MNIFSRKKQNCFKNIQQQKEINFFIPKKYTILLNKDLSANSHIYNNPNSYYLIEHIYGIINGYDYLISSKKIILLLCLLLW